MKNEIELIKRMIAADNVSEAVRRLTELSNQTPGRYSNEIIMCSAKWVRFCKDDRHGIWSENNRYIERNKIIISLLSLLEELQKSFDETRIIDNGGSVGSRVQNNIVKVLFLASNPVMTTSLQIDEEVRALSKVLREAKFGDRFELEQQWAVRIGDLEELLFRIKPTIVHFSGHSMRTGDLVLHDEYGREKSVPKVPVGKLFSILKKDIRCVVLNSCFSFEQAFEISNTIECVVGIKNEISDSVAKLFSISFYQALGYGESVQKAFEIARLSLEMNESASLSTGIRLIVANENQPELFLLN